MGFIHSTLNNFDHAIEVRHNFVVPESYYSIAFFFEPPIANRIVGFVITMLSTVDFND